MSNSSTKLIPRPRTTSNPLSRSLPVSNAGASGTAPAADRVLKYRADHSGDRSLKKTAQVSPLQMSTPSMRTGTTFKTNKLQTKNSTWTPILHKPSNEQVILIIMKIGQYQAIRPNGMTKKKKNDYEHDDEMNDNDVCIYLI